MEALARDERVEVTRATSSPSGEAEERAVAEPLEDDLRRIASRIPKCSFSTSASGQYVMPWP